MSKHQFIVRESDKDKRKEFYEYIHNNYKLKDLFHSKQDMIDYNHFPFVVDFKEKKFWVCTSVACCAAAAQNNKIITIQEFKERNKK